MAWRMGFAVPRAKRQEKVGVEIKIEQLVQPVALFAEVGQHVPGGTLASASRMASPVFQERYSRNSRRYSKRFSVGPGSLPPRPTSMTKGTASMRKPATPSESQKFMIFLTSARTAGLRMFRSGWKS